MLKQSLRLARNFSCTRRVRFFGQGSPSPDQLKAMERLRDTIQSNPQLMDSLKELQEKIVAKGVLTPGQQPSMMQMMSLMTDKEIRGSLVRFKEVLDGTGVKFDREDMQMLGEFFMKK